MKAVILSAGASSRFWPINGYHKSLIKIMGKPLIFWLIKGLEEKGIKEIIVIQGPNKEAERELADFKTENSISYVVQPEPKGTGDAILRAKDLVDDQFFVLNAERIDAKDHIGLILDKFKEQKSKLVLLAGETSNPWLYGILKVEGDKVIDLIEKPERGEEPSNLKIVGTYFLPKEFFDYLEKVPAHMYSLEEALLLYAKKEDVRIVKTEEKTFSLKYPWHLFEMKDYLFNNFLEREIDETANISNSAEIKGKAFIGKNVKVLEGAVIKGPCYIGDNTIVGNNALIREYSNIEEDCLIGGFSEVTRSIFQRNVHTHSGYFGDSIFGRGCRIGAGTITANVRIDRETIESVVKGKAVDSGLNQLGSIVGNDTKIGVHVSLMPGVLVGGNCKIGPHSIVLDNIEDNTTFYTKAQSVVKKK
jgi:bifunctional UDP-N-acetylglucosamine pyrophosphorylase/glucosamine-1-phosphate N-acetyltransferase